MLRIVIPRVVGCQGRCFLSLDASITLYPPQARTGSLFRWASPILQSMLMRLLERRASAGSAPWHAPIEIRHPAAAEPRTAVAAQQRQQPGKLLARPILVLRQSERSVR